MTNDDWRQRISIDAAIHHGDPCIKRTRVPVSIIVGSIADGDSHADLLKSYPQLGAVDVEAALRHVSIMNPRL